MFQTAHFPHVGPTSGEPGDGPGRHAIGIDLGGTKIEAVTLDPAGAECWRRRIPSPAHDYAALLDAIAGLVAEARARLPAGAATPGIGIGGPGSPMADGRIKNANTTCLNGRPLASDLAVRLGLPVRVANDANCLALSEATDGAGAGAAVVFATILGTGTGAGIAVNDRVLQGPNGLAGEWGHNPLPWARADEPRPPCYCGQAGCIESLLSGPAMAQDHAGRHGGGLTAREIAAAADAGNPAAADTLDRWLDRLARALAGVINLLDPDVIVLGGGLSGIGRIYQELPQRCRPWIFSAGADEPLRTRVLPARHGDSSGVRGAAWLGRAG
jgi:fructokinase